MRALRHSPVARGALAVGMACLMCSLAVLRETSQLQAHSTPRAGTSLRATRSGGGGQAAFSLPSLSQASPAADGRVELLTTGPETPFQSLKATVTYPPVKYDLEASKSTCEAKINKKMCHKEPINPNPEAPFARLCRWSFSKCRLTRNYDKFFTIDWELLNRYKPPSRRNVYEGHRDPTLVKTKEDKEYSKEHGTEGRDDAESETQAAIEDKEDEDAVTKVLGDLSPEYQGDGNEPAHEQDNEFASGEPYGGLRLWSVKKNDFVRHNFSKAVWDRWKRHHNKRRTVEWCSWGSQMVPCTPGFGGAWYRVGKRWTPHGVWPASDLIDNDYSGLDRNRTKMEEVKKAIKDATKTIKFQDHVAAGRRTRDYLFSQFFGV